MKFIKYQFMFLMIIHGYLFSLGGISIGGGLFALEANINDEQELFSLNATNHDDLSSVSGMFLIYFDALPKDLSVELSFEYGMQPLQSNIDYDGIPLISEDLIATKASTYYTINKELLGFSVPFLAKAGLYLGGGYNTHSSISPSIDLLKTLFDQENLEELFDNLDNSENIYENFNDIDWGNYTESTTGWHIQASLRAELLMMHMLLNAKYTFAQLPISDAIGFPSINLMLGIGL